MIRFFSFTLILSFLFVAGPASAGGRQNAVVQEVLTGDSVRLEGGKTLKYIGVESPPMQSTIPLLREYGVASREYNKSSVEGKTVTIEWDSQVRNNQKQLIGYVFLEDGTFLNEDIVKNGHARVRIHPPNIRYSETLRRAELLAAKEKKGLWEKEAKNPYLDSRYIGEKNTKIFYFPNSPELDRIPQAHLVKFRTRVDAKAAGYRPCPTCKEGDKEVF